MRRFASLAVCCLAWCYVGAAQSSGLQQGVVISHVVCAGNPQESYSLYLPKQFSPDKQWPIIYAFDPLARGKLAVETIRDAAEAYGYIVVGSNNSRNGDNAGSTEAVKAMWEDTQQRFPIDENRRYFAGMSGGARIATALALSCNGCVAGVIANAASFPARNGPSRETKFSYFASVGDADFNFAEFVQLRRELDENGVRYRIRTFDGQHGWAPAEVWMEALNWMDLEAIRSGHLQRDGARIQKSYDAAIERAGQLQSKKDLLEAFREYKFALREFTGLLDTSAAEKAVAELERNKQVRNAEKQELSDADDEFRLMSQPSSQMQALAAGKLGENDFMALRDKLAKLRNETSSTQTQDRRRLVQRRALDGLAIQAFESGQLSMKQKQYDVAQRFFDLAIAGSQNAGWAHYHRARAFAAMGDKKHMLAELKLASGAGFRDPATLEAPEFEPLRSDPEFRVILQEWSAQK